jgi:hypothetical protein
VQFSLLFFSFLFLFSLIFISTVGYSLCSGRGQIFFDSPLAPTGTQAVTLGLHFLSLGWNLKKKVPSNRDEAKEESERAGYELAPGNAPGPPSVGAGMVIGKLNFVPIPCMIKIYVAKMWKYIHRFLVMVIIQK